ncbi:hypothetical protein Hdeb2414_s0003g00099821 [Helianthus debilis subsp. tardiflorus]
MDKKWKLSKEDPSNQSSKSSSLFRSMSQKSSTKSPLLRSFSTKSSSKNKFPSDLSRSSSQKCSSFTRKCGHLAKEQKAKFYIVKRCVTMLVCWKKHGDS